MTGKRRLLSLFIILFILSFSLQALENKYENYFSFQITPQFELANGLINEYVFHDECKNTDNKLSELNWHLKTIALFNLNADINILKYFALNFSWTFGVPQRSDFMQDSDWRNSYGYSYKSWLEDNPTEKTDFSEHINHLTKLTNLKISLGGNIYLPFEIKLTPHIAFKYDFVKFDSSKGYGLYKSINKKFVPYDWAAEYSDNIIGYEQTINSYLFGITLNSETIPKTRIKLRFDISPKLTTINAIDYHYYPRGEAFMDVIKDVILIEGEATVQYKFSKNHSAGIYGRIQSIPLSKGTNYKRKIDRKGIFQDEDWVKEIVKGGTERFIWSFGFNYSFSL